MTTLAQIETHKRGTLTVQGHTLALLAGNTDGAGTPLILLHGITSSTTYAVLTLRPPSLLARPWYALSLPGHPGASYPPGFTEADMTPEHLAAVFTDAVGQITKGGSALLIGHSTGGFAALLIAATAPHLTERVVCAAGFAQGSWGTLLGTAQRFASWGTVGWPFFWGMFLPIHTQLAARQMRTTSQAYAADWAGFEADPRNIEISAQVLPDVRTIQAQAMWPWFRKMPHTDITPMLGQITAPLLAIAGDSDPVVPPSQAEHIAQHTNGDLVLLPGLGHLIMQEGRAAYDAAVDAWLGQNS